MIGYGIDVSHHQDPTAIPWKALRGKVDVVMARASFGAALLDRHCVEHLKRARAIAAAVGVYQFFRPVHSVDAQWSALLAMVDAAGLGAGDIVPAIDIERDPYSAPANVRPAWSEPCEELVRRIVDRFGDAIVYVTQADWTLLGKPKWVLERPLWVAHWAKTGGVPPLKPAAPGSLEPFMWQHRVSWFDPAGPGEYRAPTKTQPFLQLDQNRVLRPLPCIRYASVPPASSIDAARVAQLNALSLHAQARASVDDALDPRRRNREIEPDDVEQDKLS